MTARFTVDDLARPMALGRDVRRIVWLAPACTECLIALGALDRLVGVEEHSDLAGLGQIARVGGFKHVDTLVHGMARLAAVITPRAGATMNSAVRRRTPTTSPDAVRGSP